MDESQQVAAYRTRCTSARDGVRLLRAVFGDSTPPRLRTLPQVEVLRQVWLQQYW
ncbi:hypothetical protein [Streptomyces sp. NPDC102360]|uniref:hypothetical protein n=1 Tax=Streptomyces sp. NPDC102360 TaxID=3366160 RepID=UPI00382429F3